MSTYHLSTTSHAIAWALVFLMGTVAVAGVVSVRSPFAAYGILLGGCIVFALWVGMVAFAQRLAGL